MKKVLSVLVLVLLSVCCLAGCKKDKGDVIKLGVVSNLSVAAQFYGEEVVNGYKLAVNEINKAGGVEVNGKKMQLELVIKDDAADPTTAVTQYNLMADDIDAVLGATITGTSIALSEACNADGMPMVTPSGTGDRITYDDGKLKSTVFRTCFIDSYQGTILAKFAKDKNVKTVVLFENSTSDYSQGITAAFSAGASEYGYEVVKTLTYDKLDTLKASMASYTTQTLAALPDAVVVPDYTDEVRTVVAALRSAGYTGIICGGDGWDGVTEGYDHPAYFVNTFYATAIYPNDTAEKVASFYAKYKASFNDLPYKDGHSEVPSMFAALAYDAV
ncbi:MAG: ABC transporter substrate-binding protein [Bacilli bacterium]|nr:ABC transporter substrate-binding protein [Bacilli bacterium]